MRRQTATRVRQGLASALLFLVAVSVQAQIQVSRDEWDSSPPYGVYVFCRNVRVEPRDEKTAVIKFDISNFSAWRHDVNHDAAWIFFKVRKDGEKEWQHVRLAADRVLNPTGYGQGSGVAADFLVPDAGNPDIGGMGLFMRRADHGMGFASATDVTMLWDLTRNPGIGKDTKVILSGFATHMVYVAKGPFYLGTSGDESYSFYQSQPEREQAAETERIVNATSTMVVREQRDPATEFPPYHVTNSAAIPTGKQPGRLWARGAEPADSGEIPASFPNGFKAFYMMYIPLMPGEYGFFLNTISPEEADRRYHPEGFPCHGNVARIGEAPNFRYRGSRSRKSACLWWMGWADAASFADWAGLRPMTELEHQKALRGPRYPAVNEAGHSFWGGSYGGGRYNAHPREFQVTVANAVGRAYEGTHGSGTATNWPADWPKKDALGVGVHGGQEGASGPEELKAPFWCTSSRIDAALGDPDRFVTYGFRPARTAPEEAKWNTVKDEEELSPMLQGWPGSRDE